jgi:hypothetical protein
MASDVSRASRLEAIVAADYENEARSIYAQQQNQGLR